MQLPWWLYLAPCFLSSPHVLVANIWTPFAAWWPHSRCRRSLCILPWCQMWCSNHEPTFHGARLCWLVLCNFCAGQNRSGSLCKTLELDSVQCIVSMCWPVRNRHAWLPQQFVQLLPELSFVLTTNTWCRCWFPRYRIENSRHSTSASCYLPLHAL